MIFTLIHKKIFSQTTRQPPIHLSIIMSEAPTPVQPTTVSKASASISIPSTKRANQKESNSLRNTEDLPPGIVITGGLKLRSDGLTGKGVRVAVIDSGVDANHEGFDGKVTKQMWFRYGTPLSQDDHGTHVAGTIHMMAPDAEIHDYRVFGKDGFEIDDAIATSIYESCFDGCDIINMSLGGRWPSSTIRSAVQYAHSRGVIVVCAAGNEGDANPLTNERSYPALWPEALCIAAVGKSGKLPVAYFSNTNPEVDYSGIGVDAISFQPGGGTQEMSGTSMACPHVCGLITALLDKGPNSNPHDIKNDAELREVLNEKYLIDIGVKGADNATGLGFLSYLTKREIKKLWKLGIDD
mmetsp:Transcript_14777/g.18734  ORF Transcript_14777/g.18734 Transcript_14777/m.18734 type:complete len:353 (+) Transcript_14777:21-1079(+)